MENHELEKSKAFALVDLLDYTPSSVLFKTIIHKTTGNVTAASFDSGESLAEKISPFDTFIQIIDGAAQIEIDGNTCFVETGQSIIIPAHMRTSIKASERFKMVSTVIKSGYEELV